ncbi:hypothetical protein D3C79_1030150 [compost metagenome]
MHGLEGVGAQSTSFLVDQQAHRTVMLEPANHRAVGCFPCGEGDFAKQGIKAWGKVLENGPRALQ